MRQWLRQLRENAWKKRAIGLPSLIFLALYEEIVEDNAFQELHPNYAHKIFHIFLCHLKSNIQQSPAELDAGQTGSEWVDIQKASQVNLYPLVLRESLDKLLSRAQPLFLGTRKLPLPR